MNATLLIDGNSFTFKAISVYEGVGKLKLFLIEKEREDFLKLLAYNFITEFNKFKNVIDRIIIVADSHSWRKDINDDYKANRTKDSNINWNNYYILVNEFYDILKNNGVIISRVDEAEGDDLLYRWCYKLNSNNESCIVISGDRDLNQLSYFNEGVFTIMYDNTRGINTFFCSEDFINSVSDFDSSSKKITNIFGIDEYINTNHEIDPNISGIISGMIKRGAKIDIVDKRDFIIRKIIRGDRSDNVKSAYSVVKNNRNMGIGEKATEKIMESFYNRNRNLEILSDSFVNELSTSIKFFMGLKDKDLNEIKEGIIRNSTLMYLSDKTIPSKTIQDIDANIEEFMQVGYDVKSMLNIDSLLKTVVKEKVETKTFNLF